MRGDRLAHHVSPHYVQDGDVRFDHHVRQQDEDHVGREYTPRWQARRGLRLMCGGGAALALVLLPLLVKAGDRAAVTAALKLFGGGGFGKLARLVVTFQEAEFLLRVKCFAHGPSRTVFWENPRFDTASDSNPHIAFLGACF